MFTILGLMKKLNALIFRQGKDLGLIKAGLCLKMFEKVIKLQLIDESLMVITCSFSRQ